MRAQLGFNFILLPFALFNIIISFAYSSPSASLFQRIKSPLDHIVKEGQIDGYFPFYAWHNRYMYSPQRLSTTSYNERAYGFGLGKSLWDEHAYWQGVYAMAFSDSHNKIQPISGYGFLKGIEFYPKFKLGVGGSIFLTARPDIFKGRPFPGGLPLIAVTYQQASLYAAYIPGKVDFGNVLFLFMKWSFKD